MDFVVRTCSGGACHQIFSGNKIDAADGHQRGRRDSSDLSEALGCIGYSYPLIAAIIRLLRKEI